MAFILHVPSALEARGGIDIWLLGSAIAKVGQYFSRNIGLIAGTYGLLKSTVFMGAADVCFCFCVSEITGVLPFGGGAYGLARCTLAFLIGGNVLSVHVLHMLAFRQLQEIQRDMPGQHAPRFRELIETGDMPRAFAFRYVPPEESALSRSSRVASASFVSSDDA